MEENKKMEFYYSLSEDFKNELLNDSKTSDELKELMTDENACFGIKMYSTDDKKCFYLPIYFYSHRIPRDGVVDDLTISNKVKENFDINIREQKLNNMYASKMARGIIARSHKTVSTKIATILFDSIIEIREDEIIKIEKTNSSKISNLDMNRVSIILKQHINTIMKHFDKVKCE